MVSQRCQVAGKPRAVAERSLAEFDGCFSVAKVLTCPPGKSNPANTSI